MKSVLYVLDYLILRKAVDNYYYRTRLIDTRTFRVKVINAQEMFKTSGAAELDISHFDASNVTDMGLMFNGMTELSSLTLGNNFDARKVTNMTSSLGYLGSLKTIDLMGVKLRDVIDMSRLFNGSKLEQITYDKIYKKEKLYDYCCNRAYWSR